MTVFQLSPSKFKVQDFLDNLTDPPDFYEDDECYNVTPEDIYTKYGFLVFKFDKSCAGYLMVAFVFENYDNDMMFSIEDDKLILYNATISSTSFVDIKTEKTNAVGEIAFEKEQIVLIEYSENTASGKMESSSISANETSST